MNAKNLCCFASYSKDSILHDYVIQLIESIKIQLDCDIVFTTTSDYLEEKDYVKLNEHTISINKLENTHYDFGSYLHGLKQIKSLQTYENIFLINDSIYGPLSNLEQILNKMSVKSCDVWGITNGLTYGYHIQSYFVCIKRKAFQCLNDFVVNYTYPTKYWDVVMQGEINLSQHFLRNGYKLDTLINSYDIHEHVSNIALKGGVAIESPDEMMSSNVMFSYWKECCVDFSCPFIKVKLLKDGIFYNLHTSRWRSLIKNLALQEAIDRHLQYEFVIKKNTNSKLKSKNLLIRLIKLIVNPTRLRKSIKAGKFI